MDMNRNKPNDPKNGGRKPRGSIWITILVTVGIILVITSIYSAITGSQYEQTTYTESDRKSVV